MKKILISGLFVLGCFCLKLNLATSSRPGLLTQTPLPILKGEEKGFLGTVGIKKVAAKERLRNETVSKLIKRANEKQHSFMLRVDATVLDAQEYYRHELSENYDGFLRNIKSLMDLCKSRGRHEVEIKKLTAQSDQMKVSYELAFLWNHYCNVVTPLIDVELKILELIERTGLLIDIDDIYLPQFRAAAKKMEVTALKSVPIVSQKDQEIEFFPKKAELKKLLTNAKSAQKIPVSIIGIFETVIFTTYKQIFDDFFIRSEALFLDLMEDKLGRYADEIEKLAASTASRQIHFIYMNKICGYAIEILQTLEQVGALVGEKPYLANLGTEFASLEKDMEAYLTDVLDKKMKDLKWEVRFGTIADLKNKFINMIQKYKGEINTAMLSAPILNLVPGVALATGAVGGIVAISDQYQKREIRKDQIKELGQKFRTTPTTGTTIPNNSIANKKLQ
jgi:hypothetical protein